MNICNTGLCPLTIQSGGIFFNPPTDAFRIVGGETVIGGMHGRTRHHHCDYCKSWLYTEPEGVESFVNVRSTMFDDPRSEPPFVEVYVGEGLSWAKIGAPTRNFERITGLDRTGEHTGRASERESGRGDDHDREGHDRDHPSCWAA